jgi:diguanylate cyclase (GGDEF)-like protein
MDGGWRPGERSARTLVIALSIALAFLFNSTDGLERIDHLAYDYALTWQQNRVSEQVVVVAIDDESLRQLGRWPWSRRQQADLLDRLTELQAKAVGLDILLSEQERDDAAADLRLAEAMQRNGKTVLAVAPSQPARGTPIAEILPLPELAAAAAALGHVDIEIDTDGLCRSFFTHAGIGDARWPAFALALMAAAGEYPARFKRPDTALNAYGWRRHGRYYVPYDPRPNPVATVSAYQLLTDSSVADQLRDRYVLIGSTATGLGDVVSTPVSYDHQRMPGVELNAHILSGLLAGAVSRDMSTLQQGLLSMALAAGGALLIVSSSFPLAVVLLFISVLAIIATSALLLIGAQLWFAPAAAIAPLVLCFPLWGAWTLLREKRINRSLTVRMEHQALHHAATDLPNQYILDERLRELHAQPLPTQRPAALMIVHISWSRSIGGMVGRAAGDDLLRAIGARLSDAVRDDDLVAHLNGDDFGILIEHLDTEAAAERIANNLMETLRQPLVMDEASLYLSPRMGMSLWPRDSEDGPSLLRNAFTAMFRARIEGASKPCIYSHDMAREVEAHSQLERALVSAMERNEFEVYYQPQVNTTDGRFVGVEALLRWQNPELGLVYPGTFIPIAEHNGLIQEIGSWVLHTACQQIQEWNRQGLGPLRLAVNLSPLQLVDGDLLMEVQNALDLSGLDPSTLELEITESALMQDRQAATRIMQTLRDLGVKLAIDDFGTGYSSLSHLQHFPFDRIKIDRSFVREINDNPDVREITLTIIGMAKRLRMQVIAEGVETDSQVDFLDHHGCDELQGFLFSHPLPAMELAELLRLGPRKRAANP